MSTEDQNSGSNAVINSVGDQGIERAASVAVSRQRGVHRVRGMSYGCESKSNIQHDITVTKKKHLKNINICKTTYSQTFRLLCSTVITFISFALMHELTLSSRLLENENIGFI